ncbi:MAG: extracellular solute-binding protein [Chloroflexi bacterium]|nr:extracellular solute-binding protein [Chloroflexota bacterium]
MKIKLSVVVLLILISGLMACTPTAPTAAPSPTARPEQQPASQVQWEKVLKDARAEGKLTIATAGGAPGLNAAIAKYWSDKFGVEVEWLIGASGTAVIEKINRERRAGIYSADIISIGTQPYFQLGLEPITDPVQPMLVLADSKDTSKFLQGKPPFVDAPDSRVALFMLSAQSIPVINTDMVKKGEIASIRDFVNPKWKGKVVYRDTSVTGPGLYWYRMVLKNVFPNEAEGRAYFREMAKGMEVTTRDVRQLTEWVAKGKFAIALGLNMEIPLQFMQEGAPVDLLDTPEPRRLASGLSAWHATKNAPHPAATQLWANWALSKEGLTAMSQMSGLNTVRGDIPPPAGQHPLINPRPGDYMTDKAEAMEGLQYLKMIKEDFAPLFGQP